MKPITFTDENFEEYISGCELLALSQNGNELNFVQIGHPAIYLFRPGLNVQPIASHVDLSLDMTSEKNYISPLPTKLLGTENNIQVEVKTIVPQVKDKLVLLSRT